jgi:hypothetical protein
MSNISMYTPTSKLYFISIFGMNFSLIIQLNNIICGMGGGGGGGGSEFKAKWEL